MTGHHFLRTPRPGQGRLTGKPTVSLSLVLISPTTEDQAQALRDWGDFVHLNYIVEAGIPGFTMITPYENATRGDPRYLHFYEFDDPEAEITFKRMRPLVEAHDRRVGHAGMRRVGSPPRAADHVRQLVRTRGFALGIRTAGTNCPLGSPPMA